MENISTDWGRYMYLFNPFLSTDLFWKILREKEDLFISYPQPMGYWIGSAKEILFNPFPYTTILQQTTLKIFCQKIENLYNWMDNLWQKVENIVAKGEIARFEPFLLLSLCVQRAVCCRGVRKRLYEGRFKLHKSINQHREEPHN